MARLLVIDDEGDIRHLYAEELEDDGHDVDTAGNSGEALALLKSGSYDLVVLDIQLEQESGLELLQEITTLKKELSVILCTAFSSYKEDFSSWLADAYVVKSSDMNELKSEVQRILQRHA
jgi:DNA-binding response OmpR family regulator